MSSHINNISSYENDDVVNPMNTTTNNNTNHQHHDTGAENDTAFAPVVLGENKDSETRSKRKFLCIIELPPHVTHVNMFVYYLAALMTIAVFVFINAAQPYVLQTYLNVPEDKQGATSGDLAFCNELVIIIVAYLWGTLSDFLGSRKLVYLCGFLFMGMGLGLYPFATSVLVLFVFRVVFALGAASTSSMLTAVLADYTVDKDRGKATGLLGVVSGLGAVIAAIFLLKLPTYFQGWHFREKEAGYMTYVIVAISSIVMCFVVLFGLGGPLIDLDKRWKLQQEQLEKKKQQQREQEEESNNGVSDREQLMPQHSESEERKKSIFTLIKEGILAAKDPMILLSYVTGFVARGDSVLITTFITLWVSQQMQSLHGATPAQGVARGGLVSGIAQTCALVAAPFVGFFCDKVNRVGTLVVVSLISGVGYTMTHFLKDVTQGFVYLPICLIGVGEIGVIICSQILVTQSAPKDVRGSVSGVFTLFGAAGVLLTTKVGGILYDKWRPSGPFVLIGVLNFMVAALALVVFIVDVVKRKKNNTKQQISEEYEETRVTHV